MCVCVCGGVSIGALTKDRGKEKEKNDFNDESLQKL